MGIFFDNLKKEYHFLEKVEECENVFLGERGGVIVSLTLVLLKLKR